MPHCPRGLDPDRRDRRSHQSAPRRRAAPDPRAQHRALRRAAAGHSRGHRAHLRRLYRAAEDRRGHGAHRGDGDREEDITQLRDMASEAPVIRLVNLLIEQGGRAARLRHPHRAVRGRACASATASTACCTTWRRRRGACRPPSSRASRSWPSSNIAERRLPQDGRIQLTRARASEIDMRVVDACRRMHGERSSCGSSTRPSVMLDFDELGLRRPTRSRRFDALIDQPHGIILVTGPTGSGKTTTLYARARQDQLARA